SLTYLHPGDSLVTVARRLRKNVPLKENSALIIVLQRNQKTWQSTLVTVFGNLLRFSAIRGRFARCTKELRRRTATFQWADVRCERRRKPENSGEEDREADQSVETLSTGSDPRQPKGQRSESGDCCRAYGLDSGYHEQHRERKKGDHRRGVYCSRPTDGH